MTIRSIFCVSFAAAAAISMASVPVWAQSGKTGTVKFGLNETLSGNYVAVGLPPAAAARMAVKEINDKGGFTVGDTTYKIDLIEVDNQSTSAAAVAGMTKLVEDDKVKVVFGPTLSALANQAEEITVPAHVIELSAATSWQQRGDLSNPAKPLLFGTQLAATKTAKIDVGALVKLGIKKVAYMSTDDDTTRGSMPSFMDEAKAQGLTVVTILFPAGTADFSSYVSRAKNENVDGIYFLYPQVVAPELLRYVVDFGAATKGFGGRGLEPDVALSKAIGKPVPIPFFATLNQPSFSYPANDKVKAYVQRITAFEPKVIGTTASFSFYSYDYVYMVTEAMKQAGTIDDTAKIANALSTMTYDGVAGKICFGKDLRTASLDGGLLIVKDGKVTSESFPSDCR